MVPQYLKPSFSERMAAARDAHRTNGTSGGKGYRMRPAGDYAPVDKQTEKILADLHRLKWQCRDIVDHAEWILGGMKPHEYIPF